MKLFKIALACTLIVLLVTRTDILSVLKPKPTYAVGDLSVDWGPGITPGDPIFEIQNMAPGDDESHGVVITNDSTDGRPVAVKGTPTSNTGNLSDAMDITISNGSTVLYGPKTVTEFFQESLDPEGIPLMTINPGDAHTLTFLVEFQEEAGNEYQNKELIFDIIIGISIDIPEACGDVDMVGRFPLFGTSGNDTLRGTTKADVIVGLEGNDRIDGGLGNDCIIGGEGNDALGGGNGHDAITGDGGNDTLSGGNNNDTLSGREGEDEIDGGNGRDMINGDDDDDTIKGGNDADEIDAGNGNDTVDAGNGNDTAQGDTGNDSLKGGNGTDALDGGDGTDNIEGGNGKDDCTTGETLKSCE